jgi:putative sterol carrier protein
MRGRSDNEILAWIDSVGGTEAFLEQAFSGMCDAFRAERAAGRGAIMEWDIRTPDRGVVSYQVVVQGGVCHAERGVLPEPEVVLAIDMVDFLRLLLGSLDSREAVETGKLGVSGDRMLARTIREWFQGSN